MRACGIGSKLTMSSSGQAQYPDRHAGRCSCFTLPAAEPKAHGVEGLGRCNVRRAMPSLAALSLGFRNAYLDHARLTAQLQAWADAFPSLCRLTSIAKTPEGRDVWLATIGPDPERLRPAVWVGGNIHAAELAGSSVALAIAEDILRLHLEGPGTGPLDLPAAVAERLRQVVFFVVPRIS